MKIILSILLSFGILTAGVPISGQTEAVREDRQAAAPVQTIVQDGEQKKLTLGSGEALALPQKTGYHIETTREIKCSHTTSAINGSIKCKKAANPLNPKRAELKNGVELTGKLKGKKHTLKIIEYDSGGNDNTVTHLRMSAQVDAPGIEDQDVTLATPYVCAGDGYAGYAYFEIHFSYCPNSEKFYKIAGSHVWLGCTKDDGGVPEFHDSPFTHTFKIYKYVPNKYTVSYDANGGSGTAEKQNAVYDTDLTLNSGNNLARTGYTLTGWNTQRNGSGTAYGLGAKVKNLASGNGGNVVLYAQWKPNVYTITLNNRLMQPDKAGTVTLYKKYGTGVFCDSQCTVQMTSAQGNIAIPEKNGYKFKGYYNRPDKAEKQMIDEAGRLTKDGMEWDISQNVSWYAHYNFLVGCEDYADIPCDITKAEEDVWEDLGVRLTYDDSAGKTIVHTGQKGCSISIIGQCVGTEIGDFKSYAEADSAFGKTGETQGAELSMSVTEGAAYRLQVSKEDKILYNQQVYYKDGRFRTLVKLGEKEVKEAVPGTSLAGSAWGTQEPAYGLYQYCGCSERENIQASGNVQRYFRYKDINMAYSGNGATAGNNILECNVSLEDLYQFRDNGFTKEMMEHKRTKDQKEYECKVKYSFQGWELSPGVLYDQKQQEQAIAVYETAKSKKALSIGTIEDISTYQAVSGSGNRAAEYINLLAKWDAFPTIVVAPGDKLEFYEGEDVTKEKLISHLIAHDSEDNEDNAENPDMNGRLRIIRISYPESRNRSQAAYEENYEIDVPEGFLLDTYYLKLEKDEAVDVFVTFAVTDSVGNTTEEKIPVKVKYNNYPVINSEDTFYYLKEEANRGEITAEALLKRAAAEDTEDGDLTGKMQLKDFDAQEFKMQTESRAEFAITYQVTDSYKKTSYKTVKALVWDEDAAIAEMPRHYVRYISEKYLDTLEENSAWREPENLAYLQSILKNKTPMETWKFTHEQVLAIQEWITEGGSWKIGQEANCGFLAKFAHCRQ